MKILVTGGSGFIGSKLITALETKGYSVSCIDLTTGYDLSQWDSVKDLTSFDVLIHLAAMTYVPKSYEIPREMYRININGTLNALELCKINNAKMIFNSSYVYGHPQYLPIDEKHPIDALNPYAQSKIIGEKLCESYAKDLKVPVCIFRIFNVYGQGLAKHFLIPKIIDQLKRNNRAFLEDPTPKRDYVHIDDLVRAYIHTLEQFDSGYETLNIGSGQSLSVEEIGNTVLASFSKGAEIHYSGKQRPNEVMDTRANIQKAEHLIHWKPLVPFEEGIAKLVRKELG